jgi:dCTP diphosphatase
MHKSWRPGENPNHPQPWPHSDHLLDRLGFENPNGLLHVPAVIRVALRQTVATFVDTRNWKSFHRVKNLPMSIAIEAADLMERFQWLTTEETQATAKNSAERAAVAGELADIIIYCLSPSNALDLDVSSAVLGKLQTSEHRYPADGFRGRFRRPEREKGDER